ncbi:hypothetical protein PTTG_05120 [Puccinia triticina 1-1 BBBD Race 1]|uniref:Uncharacterized protein n=1 Tax=Puccinia triticina (isolate 1-1 / race 1 (BBBD)) TaxID=630390 RepID=A0A180GPJ4_PUCT1|nr:hypothetical protein PTTG_05120 [Puccinia triticina 1-1 BBBD Race 1]
MPAANSAPAPAPTSESPPASTNPTKRRGPNFTPEEDKQLAKSWVHISKDAIKSNNQKIDKFWECVFNDFTKFSPGPVEEFAASLPEFLSAVRSN